MRDISILNTRKGIPIASDRTPKLINIADRTQDNLDSAKLKIAIYSHDTKGLGHMRRNLLISGKISSSFSNSSVLLITGSREINRFRIPEGVDCLTLPSYYKESDDNYKSRSLKVSLDEIVTLRSSIIKETLKSYSPDLFIVDYAAKGGLNELNKTLKYLRKYSSTLCVLGLRDILGDPKYVLKEWNRKKIVDFIDDHYDYVWVYADPGVYNMCEECNLPEQIQSKITFTGYLGHTDLADYKEKRNKYLNFDFSSKKIVLCVLGGGQDGIVLADKFAETKIPRGYVGLLLTGPYMSSKDKDRLRLKINKNPGIKLVEFIPDPIKLFNDAERIISMGGYNTVCELLANKKKALVVPRVNSRREQVLRAEKLSAMGLVDTILPHELSPEWLNEWLKKDIACTDSRSQINMDGLSRMPVLIKSIISENMAKQHNYRDVLSL